MILFQICENRNEAVVDQAWMTTIHTDIHKSNQQLAAVASQELRTERKCVNRKSGSVRLETVMC